MKKTILKIKMDGAYPRNLIKIFLFLLILLNINQNLLCYGQSHPGEDGDCEDGHSAGPYSISTPVGNILMVGPGAQFKIPINASGPGVIVCFNPIIQNNSYFSILPTNVCVDNSQWDLDIRKDEVSISFDFEAPQYEANYTILIYARSPTEFPTRVVGLSFLVVVNATYSDSPTWYNKILHSTWMSHLFDHMNIYIGGTAILLLGIATILFEINQHNVKIHGILATLAFLLTTTNILLIFQESWDLIRNLFYGQFAQWFHIIHISIGIVGWACGLLALLKGLAGHPTKKIGYLTLGTWIINFGLGLWYWGIGF